MGIMRGVLFDLDGTLVDCLTLHLQAAQEVVERTWNLQFTREDLEPYYGLSTVHIITEFLKKHKVEGADVEKYVRDRRDVFLELVKKKGVFILPGALKLLKELSKRKVPVGVATSNRRHVAEAILEHGGLTQFIQSLTTREDVEHGKPAPDFFRVAAKKLKLGAEDCVGIEDSIYGVQSIKSAGLKSVAVATGVHPVKELEAEQPDLVAKNLTEVTVDTLQDLFKVPAESIT